MALLEKQKDLQDRSTSDDDKLTTSDLWEVWKSGALREGRPGECRLHPLPAVRPTLGRAGAQRDHAAQELMSSAIQVPGIFH